jgi:hypothetical protein
MALNYTKTGLLLGMSYGVTAAGVAYFSEFGTLEEAIIRGLMLLVAIPLILSPIDLIAWYRARRGWVATPVQRYEWWRAAGWAAFVILALSFAALASFPKPIMSAGEQEYWREYSSRRSLDSVPPEAIAYLKEHPDTAKFFDETFGSGMAKAFLSPRDEVPPARRDDSVFVLALLPIFFLSMVITIEAPFMARRARKEIVDPVPLAPASRDRSSPAPSSQSLPVSWC